MVRLLAFLAHGKEVTLNEIGSCEQCAKGLYQKISDPGDYHRCDSVGCGGSFKKGEVALYCDAGHTCHARCSSSGAAGEKTGEEMEQDKASSDAGDVDVGVNEHDDAEASSEVEEDDEEDEENV